MDFDVRPECFAAHLGAWAVLPRWMEEAVGLIKAGVWRPELARTRDPRGALEMEGRLEGLMEAQTPGAYWVPASFVWTHEEGRASGLSVTYDPKLPGKSPIQAAREGLEAEAYAGGQPQAPRKPYVTAGNVAVLDVLGPLQKGDSKFGGTSTLRLRSALRAARDDEEVGAILLRIESPGGHVTGTKELADEVRAVDKRKPVYAYIEDLGASAAYWIASQARRISANEMAEIGSIGTFAIIADSSKAAELAGVEVHVVSTGPHKGALAPGTPVLEEHLEHAQGLVDGWNAYQLRAVQSGRRISSRQLEKVSTGRTWLAKEAQSLKLVDRVETLEGTLAGIEGDLTAKAAGQGSPRRAPRAEGAAARIRRLELEGDLG